MTRTIETDVLVVGVGGAGLRAAIEAARSNARVVVVSRSMLGKAHTTMAEGGLNAALGVADPSDSTGSHYRSTIAEGARLNDPELVRSLVDEAPDRVYDLEEYGALFDRTQEGRIAQRCEQNLDDCQDSTGAAERVSVDLVEIVARALED